jgi:carbamoylphosphate synthase large subunit
MTGTVLLTLGRLPKGLDVARSFAKDGWRVIVADPMKRHVLGASNSVSKSYQVSAPTISPLAYERDLLEVIEREKVDLVVPVSEEILHVSSLHDRCGAKIFSMPQGALLCVHDKAEFATLARSIGLKAPITALSQDRDAARAIAGDFDFIVKPRHSCAGSGVSAWEKGSAIPQADDMLVQQRIKGEEKSVCALAHDGVLRACVIYRGALMSGTVAVRFERIENAAIESWVRQFVAALSWTGFISFDFIMDEAGMPYAIECNPRLTSGVHFYCQSTLARAVLEPEAAVMYRPERLMQQFWPCLSETQASFGKWSLFASRIRSLFSTPDVTWSVDDPWPLLGMPWTAWSIISRSRQLGVSFGEAASSDIGWRAAA